MKTKSGNEIFGGKEGECVFIKPFFDFRIDMEIRQEMPDIFRKAEKSGDERSFVLVTALIIEYHLDRLLKLLFPKFKKLSNVPEFSFHEKSLMFESLKLIPNHIILCCNCINGIRNQFAHDLKINLIEEITPQKRTKLKSLYSEIYYDDLLKTPKGYFQAISFIAITGLQIYEPNIKFLRQKIDSPDFIKSLFEDSKKK